MPSSAPAAPKLVNPPQTVDRHYTAAANRTSTLADFMAVDAGCATLGQSIVRVTTPPQHGTLAIRNGTAHPSYNKADSRSQCGHTRALATFARYTPTRGYTGPDSVMLDVIYPRGGERTVTFHIDVK